MKDQLKQAKSGKTINEEDIPPEVSTAKHTSQPINTVTAPEESKLIDISPAQEVDDSATEIPDPEPEPSQTNLSDEMISALNLLTGNYIH